MRSLLLLLGLLLALSATAQSPYPVPFDTAPDATPTYAAGIDWWTAFAQAHPEVHLTTHGRTDAGEPLHLAVLSTNGTFTPAAIARSGKTVLLINNAIHAGEPAGVDATMLLYRDLLANAQQRTLLDDLVILAVPMYNVGGVLNRNSTTRANQNGPAAYGFRGNAKNLDLNRDFIKADSRNTRAITEIIVAYQPDVFIDNHTSNGADYQYTLTMIETQPDKLAAPLGDYLRDVMNPALYRAMAETPYEMIPYVYAPSTPDKGIVGFLDSPRYSTGLTALHHIIGFVPEAHMLKPYADRVRSERDFMRVMVDYLAKNGATVQQLRRRAIAQSAAADSIDLAWALDRSTYDTLLFKGYTAARKPSAVSEQDRLYYDRTRPFEHYIQRYGRYRATRRVATPRAYVVPQAYTAVLDRLSWNGVQLDTLIADTTLAVTHYYIDDFDTRRSPYEGHYLHSNVQTRRQTSTHTFRAGDVWVRTDQPAAAYLTHVLEPTAVDSYFCWNFFDAILQQKEHFSAYVFEDRAAELLRTDPDLRARFESAKAADPRLAADGNAQLRWIYRHSPHYETTHRRYPVARVE